MTIKSRLQIPLLKGGQYENHYFKHSPNAANIPGEHFGLYNRCMLRDNILAHRLDFYMIFLVNAGEGLHTFGTKGTLYQKEHARFYRTTCRQFMAGEPPG
jgi:hypothetical protein